MVSRKNYRQCFLLWRVTTSAIVTTSPGPMWWNIWRGKDRDQRANNPACLAALLLKHQTCLGTRGCDKCNMETPVRLEAIMISAPAQSSFVFEKIKIKWEKKTSFSGHIQKTPAFDQYIQQNQTTRPQAARYLPAFYSSAWLPGEITLLLITPAFLLSFLEFSS